MAFCTRCGRGLLADAQFCASCGTAVGSVTPPASPAGNVITPPTSWSPAGAPPPLAPPPLPGSVSGTGAPPSFAPPVWYPPASGPSERPISRALAVWLQVLLGCTAVLFVIAAFAVVSVRSAADSYFGSNGVTNYSAAQTWVDREDTANAVIGFAGFLSIAVAVLMIIWAFQFTRAVDRHRPNGRRWTPGWAIGAWFIPLANYFLCPAILMEDEKIAVAAARGNTEGWKNERAHPLTVFWFGAWALGGILSLVGDERDARDPSALPTQRAQCHDGIPRADRGHSGECERGDHGRDLRAAHDATRSWRTRVSERDLRRRADGAVVQPRTELGPVAPELPTPRTSSVGACPHRNTTSTRASWPRSH